MWSNVQNLFGFAIRKKGRLLRHQDGERVERAPVLERGEAAHPRGIAEELDATKQGAPNPRGAA